MSQATTKVTIGGWWRSLRAFSFPASLVPAAMAATIVLGRGLAADWWTFPLFVAAAVLFHASTNVLNDYYDYVHGVDTHDDPDPTHAISQGVVPPRFMVVAGHAYLLLAIVLGSVIAMERGPWFLLVGLLGALGSYLYTGARFSLKYVALGDLTVFLLMGPALVAIGVWSVAGRVPSGVILESLPIAFLVTAILHANNLRDVDRDLAAGVRTIANLIGRTSSRALFVALVGVPYVTLILLVVTGTVGVTALAPMITAPLAWRVAWRVVRQVPGDALIDLPVQCAMLHLAFGGVYTVSLLWA